MRNLEAKFPLTALDAAATAAQALGYVDAGRLTQRDTFFVVPFGKLKLREERVDDGPARSTLIRYGRSARDGLQLSDYALLPIADGPGLRATLVAALGELATVAKHRRLLLAGHVRLHLDEVEGLGRFGEIEAVVPDGADPERERAFVDRTLAALGVDRAALIEGSYFELAARG